MCSVLHIERPFGTIDAMRRTHVRTARVALVVAIAAAVVAAGRAAGGPGQPERPVPAVARHVVRAGETLWGIARARVGPAEDPRPLVDAIREMNRIGPGALRPGVELRLPGAP